MSHLFWHQRLCALAHDVVDRQLEELRISPALASVIRLHLVNIETAGDIPELSPVQLVGIADATESIFGFLFENSRVLSAQELIVLENIYARIVGLPVIKPREDVVF